MIPDFFRITPGLNRGQRNTLSSESAGGGVPGSPPSTSDFMKEQADRSLYAREALSRAAVLNADKGKPFGGLNRNQVVSPSDLDWKNYLSYGFDLYSMDTQFLYCRDEDFRDLKIGELELRESALAMNPVQLPDRPFKGFLTHVPAPDGDRGFVLGKNIDRQRTDALRSNAPYAGGSAGGALGAVTDGYETTGEYRHLVEKPIPEYPIFSQPGSKDINLNPNFLELQTNHAVSAPELTSVVTKNINRPLDLDKQYFKPAFPPDRIFEQVSSDQPYDYMSHFEKVITAERVPDQALKL